MACHAHCAYSAGGMEACVQPAARIETFRLTMGGRPLTERA